MSHAGSELKDLKRRGKIQSGQWLTKKQENSYLSLWKYFYKAGYFHTSTW